ncbi:methyl-accepting chemotaxis protein [Bordetella genomosp. 13]|uniref:methyl-accepting chemotaxis protein n=1 Tax=Bordetella genomosp. 13 TaxID=463040 RepID=UPI00119E62F2|nr:methyl-accepting chemotaxis protein [Bordetella genomosp. 13]
MPFIRNLDIGKRLGLAFGSVLMVLLLLGIFGIVQKQKINAVAQELGHRWLPSVRTLSEINDAFNQARRSSLRYMLDESSARREQLAIRAQIVNDKVPALFLKYETLLPFSEARQRIDEVKRSWSDYLASDVRLLELSSEGESSFQQARALAAGATASTYVAAIGALNAATAWSNERSDEASLAAAQEYRQGLYMSIAAIIAALGLGVLLARTITTSITKPLGQGVLIAEAVARGDLTRDIEAHGRDEVATLLRAMQRMSRDLSALVGDVRTCSMSIAHGAREIADGNADLSRRTEEQAGNLEEAAASMEQFRSAARSNADTANQASGLAASASEAATRGGEVVEDVVLTMSKIQEASRRISDITGLIDGIAFQTNILALNAAVEAARAGEQGRGFAVVATEVRSLAQRSASAAKEIKVLIDDSVATIAQGTGQATVAGQRMRDIVAQVRGVGQLIAEISNATSEQTIGVGQVGDAINQIDQVTQQNAALVEQSAAAADSLKAQADQLASLVSMFRIDGATRPVAVVEPPRASDTYIALPA